METQLHLVRVMLILISFFELSKINYKGNLILQTARSKSNNHAKVLKSYKSFLENRI